MNKKNGECNIYKTFKEIRSILPSRCHIPRNTLRAICEASSALVHMGVGPKADRQTLGIASIFGSQDYKWIYDSSAFKKLQKKHLHLLLMEKKLDSMLAVWQKPHLAYALLATQKDSWLRRDPSTPQ